MRKLDEKLNPKTSALQVAQPESSLMTHTESNTISLSGLNSQSSS